MNRLYPIFLKAEGIACLVVGGGDVARRKIISLLASGASVTAVSPSYEHELVALARDDEGLTLKERRYEEGDLDGASLVIAATDDADTNVRIFEAARRRGLLVNVVDKPDLCNFYVPSTFARGDLRIAISTGGACPALAKRIRLTLEQQFDGRYDTLLECLSIVRRELFEKYPNNGERRSDALHRLVHSDLIERSGELSKEDLLNEMKKWI